MSDYALITTWELPLTSDDPDEYRESEAFRSILRTRQKRMFASTYKVDTSRKTFLDLPGEIRNSVYEYALFGVDTHCWRLCILGRRRKIRTIHQLSGAWRYGEELVLVTLGLLGAMNKLIRREIQTLFWAKLDFVLYKADTLQHDALYTFLDMLGPNSRAHLSDLRLRAELRDPDPSPTGYTSLQKLLPVLRTCRNLRHLELGLYASNIFRNDFDALKNYFFRWQPLVSPGLETLVSTIEFLPHLRSIKLHFNSCSDLYHDLDHYTEHFFQFAFSGMREKALRSDIEERLQAISDRTKKHNRNRKLNGKTRVSISYRKLETEAGDEIMHFRNWLKLYAE
jgi:hypothetical protein